MAVAPLVWDCKRKKFLRRKPKEGYITKAVRDFFPSLQRAKSSDKDLKKAISLANRCYESHSQKRGLGIDAEEVEPKKRFRVAGGGRKPVAPEIREAAFQWFIDVRGGLKGRLPRKMFRMKCVELFQTWGETQEQPCPTLEFSDRWIDSWMKEYRVSLNKPNKRFALSQTERVVRLLEFLKNIWRIRHYFNVRYGKEPVVINGDQMPLHRNETSSQKTMTLKGQDTYVKENYMMSRERCTVFTQISSEEGHTMPIPEFVFKGKGVRVHLNPPEGVKVQWTPKGSYRLETMLTTISSMKNRAGMFTHKEYAIYVLDDYSVHITSEVRQALLARGYILVCIGGGITGDIQVNDTHVHHLLKKEYRERESALMLQQLTENPQKVPNPSRDDMMNMLASSWEALTVDPVLALKNNFVLNKLDGSEDYLVYNRLFEIVGREMLEFRAEMTKKPPPATLSALLATITPPKGVRIKQSAKDVPPLDEGTELFDCEGGEIAEEELEVELENAMGEDDNSRNVHVTTVTVHATSTGSNSATEETPQQVPASASTTVALSQLLVTDDETIKADSKFLDELKRVLENGKTSTLLIPYYCQLKVIYSRARDSLKKRLWTEQQLKINTAAEQIVSETESVNDASTADRIEDEVTDGPRVEDSSAQEDDEDEVTDGPRVEDSSAQEDDEDEVTDGPRVEDSSAQEDDEDEVTDGPRVEDSSAQEDDEDEVTDGPRVEDSSAQEDDEDEVTDGPRVEDSSAQEDDEDEVTDGPRVEDSSAQEDDEDVNGKHDKMDEDHDIDGSEDDDNIDLQAKELSL